LEREIKCYYIVKARTAFHNSEAGEIEFRARIKKFENPNPIEARKAAFDFRNEFICGLLTLGLQKLEAEIGWNSETKEIAKLSAREIRKLINPMFEKDNSELIIEDEEHVAPNNTLPIIWKDKFNGQEKAWVALLPREFKSMKASLFSGMYNMRRP